MDLVSQNIHSQNSLVRFIHQRFTISLIDYSSGQLGCILQVSISNPRVTTGYISCLSISENLTIRFHNFPISQITSSLFHFTKFNKSPRTSHIYKKHELPQSLCILRRCDCFCVDKKKDARLAFRGVNEKNRVLLNLSCLTVF